VSEVKLTAAGAVAALEALKDKNDPEAAHAAADTILLATVPKAVREAYVELVKGSDWWAFS
jgi:hypothetical protein